MIDSTLSPNRDLGQDDLADTIAGVLAEREGTDVGGTRGPAAEARIPSAEPAPKGPRRGAPGRRRCGTRGVHGRRGAAARGRAVSTYEKHTKPPPDRPGGAKPRKCLRCRADFVSAWAGERICRRCKGGVGWHIGNVEPVSTGRKVFPRGHGAET